MAALVPLTAQAYTTTQRERTYTGRLHQGRPTGCPSGSCSPVHRALRPHLYLSIRSDLPQVRPTHPGLPGPRLSLEGTTYRAPPPPSPQQSSPGVSFSPEYLLRVGVPPRTESGLREGLKPPNLGRFSCQGNGAARRGAADRRTALWLGKHGGDGRVADQLYGDTEDGKQWGPSMESGDVGARSAFWSNARPRRGEEAEKSGRERDHLYIVR